MAGRGNRSPVCSQPDADVLATIWCRLFSDRITDALCLLRRKELMDKESFSCKGCQRDAVLRRRPDLGPGSRTL